MTGTTRRAQRSNVRELDMLGSQLADALEAVMRPNGPSEVILTKSAIRVTNKVKQLIQESGRTTNPRTPGHTAGPGAHQPSAPGTPPATDTGRLVQSYDWKIGRDARGLFVEIGTNVEYAPDLEIGTRDMAPRPHLRVAIAAERERLVRDIMQAVEQSQRAAIARMPKVIKIK